MDSEKRGIVGACSAGFLLWCVSTVILFFQFCGYLFCGYMCEAVDWCGKTYYIISAFGHSALLCFVPFLVLSPLMFVERMRSVAVGLLAMIYALVNLVGLVNGMVFRIYKFHINGFVLDMLLGANAGQVFVFNGILVAKAVGVVLAVLSVGLFVYYLCVRFAWLVKRRRVVVFSVCALLCMLVSHIAHAYAAVAGVSSITNSALCLPQFYPLTANSLLKKMGVEAKGGTMLSDNNYSATKYPLSPIVGERVDSLQNIVVVLIDSWNARTMDDGVTCPNLTKFSKRCEYYHNHLSASNGTRGSVFGWFFSLDPMYWKFFESSGVRPCFIDRLQELEYDIEVFPSATLKSPPFDRVVFGGVDGVKTETKGNEPIERDMRLSDDFKEFLDRRDGERPFFAFLFYDLSHAIDLPKGYSRKFQPCSDYADYMSLTNDTDPTEFFNLYRNCVWHIDSLIGGVIDKMESKGLLKNTVILVSGDHSQEFNENHKNYWGHNSNFSKWQLRVPFLYYYPGVEAVDFYHRTSHYDIVPTLMSSYLGVTNPYEDYSMGNTLSDTMRQPFHIAGSYDNYAIITDSVIYEKKLAGQLMVTDADLNVYNGETDSRMLNEAILFKNRFLK